MELPLDSGMISKLKGMEGNIGFQLDYVNEIPLGVGLEIQGLDAGYKVLDDLDIKMDGNIAAAGAGSLTFTIGEGEGKKNTISKLKFLRLKARLTSTTGQNNDLDTKDALLMKIYVLANDVTIDLGEILNSDN
jgi:hypothetical protein